VDHGVTCWSGERAGEGVISPNRRYVVHTLEPVAGPAVAVRLLVLSCPPAVAPHVEFALARVLATPVSLSWESQPAQPATLRAEASWHEPAGLVEQVVAALRALKVVTFEVTSGPAPGCDAARWVWHPSLGLHHAALDGAGHITTGVGPLRCLLGLARDGVEVAHGVSELLGDSWEELVDPLRAGTAGGQVTRLRPTG
jgi:hypothetical protein